MKIIKVKIYQDIPKNYTGIVEYVDGEKHWLLNGYLHREDGPAVMSKNGCKFWYLNGEYHREDGPAIEGFGVREYWINGKPLNEEKIYFLINLEYPIKAAIKLANKEEK